MAMASLYSIYILTLALLLYMVFLLVRMSGSKAAGAFLGVVFSEILIIFGMMLEVMMGYSVDAALVCLKLQYVGQAIFSMSLLYFCSIFLHIRIPKVVYAMQFVVEVIVLIACLTAEQHTLFYSSMVITTADAPYPTLKVTDGPIWYLHYVHLFLVQFAVIIVAFIQYGKSNSRQKARSLYLCGSDLESDYGAASADIDEMLSVNLSDRVQVIIQTGGSYEWTKDIDPDRIQRYRISSSGIELIDEQPQANMGNEDTLAEFLAYCKQNYPADHTAVVFWNHGGGTVGGVAYDELYDYDSLSLTEIHDAFEQVYDLSAAEPPIDLIGFDACLMASIDTASMASDIAEVMVASEESEPGVGWEYTGFLTGLCRNTGMTAATLGRLICDSYAEGCTAEDVDDEITLSVIDLQKISELTDAYNDAGIEALSAAYTNEEYYAEFTRCAGSSENYGGNNFISSYTDMVDLGDLVRNSSELLPESASNVLTALENCVVYQVVGPYRENASGLSCYHAYDGDYDTYQTYSEAAASAAFNYFYAYALTGEWTKEAADYLNNTETPSSSTTPTQPVTPTQPQTGNLPGQSNAEDLEDYDAIKGKTFSAGVPSLTKHGLATVITFPALDRQNQVWVMSTSLNPSKPGQKFSIQKNEAAGVGNMIGNEVLDDLTGGLFGWGRMVGGNAKKCEELVELTAKELQALNL